MVPRAVMAIVFGDTEVVAEKGHQVLLPSIRPDFPQADCLVQPSIRAVAKAVRTRSLGPKMVDLKFTDLLVTGPHRTLPMERSGEHTFVEGADASAIRGCRAIHFSRAPALADTTAAVIDLFCKEPMATSSLLG